MSWFLSVPCSNPPRGLQSHAECKSSPYEVIREGTCQTPDLSCYPAPRLVCALLSLSDASDPPGCPLRWPPGLLSLPHCSRLPVTSASQILVPPLLS